MASARYFITTPATDSNFYLSATQSIVPEMVCRFHRLGEISGHWIGNERGLKCLALSAELVARFPGLPFELDLHNLEGSTAQCLSILFIRKYLCVV